MNQATTFLLKTWNLLGAGCSVVENPRHNDATTQVVTYVRKTWNLFRAGREVLGGGESETRSFRRDLRNQVLDLGSGLWFEGRDLC